MDSWDCRTESCRHDLSETINALLGRPYRDDACGPDAFDCFGLALYLARECLGVELEDPRKGPGGGLAAIRRFREHFEEVSAAELEPLDWLHFDDGGLQHFAVVEDSLWAVEASRDAGVARRPLEDALARFPRAYRVRLRRSC